MTSQQKTKDNFTDKRVTTIRELESRKSEPKIPEPESPVLSTEGYYVVFSLILFAITFQIPAWAKFWSIIGGIGVCIGVVLLGIKFCKWIDKHPDL